MNELSPPPSKAAFMQMFGERPTNSSQWTTWLNQLYEYIKENMSSDFMLDVAMGRKTGMSTVNKFGRNTSIGTSLAPVAYGGIYQTPTSAVSLEFVSSSANDALNSTGMHSITVQGLDENWELQTVTTAAHATDGTTAVNITGSWLRVFRAFVASSGSYATTSADSHVGTITIRVQGAGATYATIPLEGTFGLGQTLIGVYTVPAGYTAYILSTSFSSDISGTKTCNFYFFKRENADDVTSSYSGTMRVQEAAIGTQGQHAFEHVTNEAYPEKTDMGFMAKASATTDASVEFEILLVAN